MPSEIAALLHQKADVRHDEIDAGQVVAGEDDAEIDHDPLRRRAVAEAVERRDSCRSRRPRRAAQRRVRRSARHHGRSCAAGRRRVNGNTSPAAIVVERAVGQAQHQAARPRRAPRSGPTSSRSGSRTRRCRAEPGGAREPVGADGREALAAVPLRQAPRHRGREGRTERVRRDRRARGSQIGRRIGRAGGMVRAIDADADHDGAAAVLSPSIRMPANLAPRTGDRSAI